MGYKKVTSIGGSVDPILVHVARGAAIAAADPSNTSLGRRHACGTRKGVTQTSDDRAEQMRLPVAKNLENKF